MLINKCVGLLGVDYVAGDFAGLCYGRNSESEEKRAVRFFFICSFVYVGKPKKGEIVMIVEKLQQ